MGNWKIAVASGKGGTGKTTVAVSLALALRKSVDRVQFLDCDVEEPNAGLFIKPEIHQTTDVTLPVPSIDLEKCTGCGECADACRYNAIAVVSGTAIAFGHLCHGCGVCTYVCPMEAISEERRRIGVVERGTMGNLALLSGRLDIGEPKATPLVRALKAMADPDLLTVLDAPPGTGCPVVETVKDCDYCILVTEPTPFGLYDLRLMVEVLKVLDIPSGIVVNKDGEGSRMIDDYAAEEGLPIIMRIPLRRAIAEPLSRGVPLVDTDPSWEGRLRELFEQVECAL